MIAIFGANGYVGQHFIDQLAINDPDSYIKLKARDQTTDSLHLLLKEYKPNFIINCAGLS